MKLDRSKFAHHLERLEANGQITEAVFQDGFAAVAWTPDHLLLVVAPEFPNAEPLEEEIGVVNISLLRDALKLAPGEGKEGASVDVYLKDHRLVIDDKDRAKQELIVAAPRTIATRVEQATVDKVLKATPEDSVTLTKAALDGVRKAYALYKAEQIQIVANPKGVAVVIGSDTTHKVTVPLSDDGTDEEYSLLFGKHLIDVFSIVSDFKNAAIHLGNDQLAVVEDGDFKYVVSPRKPSADEGGTKKRKSKKAAAE